MVFPSIALAEGANPLLHVVDKPLRTIGGFTVTLHTVTVIIAAVITVFVMWVAANAISKGSEASGPGRYIAKGRFAQAIEALCIALRDKVVRPQLGDSTDKFMPFLWTLFFFILINNVIGLVPLLDIQHLIGGLAMGDTHWAVLGGTATGNIAVTGALAIIAFVIIQINGIRSSGLSGWAKHFLGGAPLYLAPIMLPVEFMGMFIKPGALAVRLFANMVAGHTLLATILLFTGMSVSAGATLFASEALGIAALGAPITIVSMLAAVALYFLEIFVAFLQAFIFMFLTTVFIAQLMHHHHDEHEGAHDYDHNHVPEAADAAVPVTQ